MRIERREQTESLSFPTIHVEVTTREKKPMKVIGFIKNPVTGLPDDVLFTDTDRLGALVDDLSEALDMIREKEKNAGNE